jgi:hypothetical protein
MGKQEQATRAASAEGRLREKARRFRARGALGKEIAAALRASQ